MSEKTSDFYLGTQGRDYFAYQNKNADRAAGLEIFKFFPHLDEQHSVLDFGCRGGWILRALAPHRAVGIEVNPTARAVCEAHGTEVHPSLDSLPPETFSRIISHHCLEHVPYPIETLKALRQRLDENGLILLVLPIDDWRRQTDYTARDSDHHLHTWTPRLLANTLAEAGFECIEVRVLTHAFPRGWETLSSILAAPLFHACCWLWSIVAKRRQLIAVAGKAVEKTFSPAS